MTLTRRAATEADIPFLMQLRRDTMDPHLAASGASTSDDYHRERVLYRFDCAEIILDDGVPSGLLKAVRSAPCWELVQIQLSPRLQGSGYGRAILESLLESADCEGVDVSMSVLKANPARRLYERLGFVITSEGANNFLMRRTARKR